MVGWRDAISGVFCWEAGRVQAGHFLMHACLAVGTGNEYMRLRDLEAVPGGSGSPITGNSFPLLLVCLQCGGKRGKTRANSAPARWSPLFEQCL